MSLLFGRMAPSVWGGFGPHNVMMRDSYIDTGKRIQFKMIYPIIFIIQPIIYNYLILIKFKLSVITKNNVLFYSPLLIILLVWA